MYNYHNNEETLVAVVDETHSREHREAGLLWEVEIQLTGETIYARDESTARLVAEALGWSL